MTKLKLVPAVVLALMLLAPAAGAQSQGETLADIRQELSVLYVEVQRLKRELSTTGSPGTVVTGNTSLERIDSIERALQRLTARTEEIEYRVNQIATVGGNQIGDLEFRLCELETSCDFGQLSEGTTLGNIDVAAGGRGPLIPAQNSGSELAVGEQADFERAKAALDSGDNSAAAEQFARFAENYPGGPLSAEAYYLRGDALDKLGDTRLAARSYLDSFSSAPNGPIAPDALYRVGTSLQLLGQTDEACQMFEQVGLRFPDARATAEANSALQNLGCL